MANPNTNITEIAVTTLQMYSGKIADNVTNHNSLLRRIQRRGNYVWATGRSIVQELEYAENATTRWYAGLETLSVEGSEVFTYAEYDPKQLAGNVIISGKERRQNQGREQVHNLLRSRIANLNRSLANTMATALFADGTGSDGKEIGGLQHLIQDDGGGTVGGISADNNTFWQNQFRDLGTTVFAGTTIISEMHAHWLTCIRGGDKPDYIVSDSTLHSAYWNALQSQERFINEDEASAGFMALKFMGADAFFDDQAPDARMFFVNTDYLMFRPYRNANFVPLEDRLPTNQDALVLPIVWMGNMTVANRRVQGVLGDI